MWTWICRLAGWAGASVLGGTFPHAGAASAPPHRRRAQGVLATVRGGGPWAGPHARGGEVCVLANPGGCSPPLGPCLCYDLDACSPWRAKEK